MGASNGHGSALEYSRAIRDYFYGGLTEGASQRDASSEDRRLISPAQNTWFHSFHQARQETAFQPSITFV